MSEKSVSKIAKLLRKSKKTLSVAESCTGGLLGAALTSLAGSSDYFMGGIITYSDRVKVSCLGVSKSSLSKHGAVSDAVAKDMARNARLRFKTDFGVSITGIAGPGGGTKAKPVGLVYVAVSTSRNVLCKKYLLRGTRKEIRSLAASKALRLLITLL